MYNLIDNKTNTIIEQYKSIKMARKQRDKLDQQYGACRYTVRLAN